MRTAYKVWSGIFVATLIVVASVDASAHDTTSSGTTNTASSYPSAAAPVYAPTTAPTRDPMLGTVSDDTAGITKTVRRVVTVRDIEFNDGTKARVDATLYAETPPLEGWERCADKLRLAAAHRLLDGKIVTVGRDLTRSSYSTPDWVRLRGYEQYSAETDYTQALSSETTQRVMDECYPKAQPTPTGSGSDVDVDVDVDRHNHRDGAFTGGFCRKHWWC